MKTKLIFTLALLATLLFLPQPTYTAVTRGTEPGEIYLSSRWYYSENDITYIGLFHSLDNGEHITPTYTWSTLNLEIPDTLHGLTYLISDATPGVLYCQEAYPRYYLWISYNDGENWEFVEGPGGSGRYTAGCIEGEVYKNGTGTCMLYQSIDYGDTFQAVNDSAVGGIEIGTISGELYKISRANSVDYQIHYSNDCGSTFTEQCILDSIPSLPWAYPTLSRGTEPGEIYLFAMGWDNGYQYYIYRSTDYGNSFILQFQSEPIDDDWGLSITAGREQGSFYVVMRMADEYWTGTYLKILYSNDYAETFTEYFHHLTEEYFVGIEDKTITQIPDNQVSLSNYPNPFNPSTTIRFKLPVATRRAVQLQIYNISGNLVKTLIDQPMESGYHTVTWNGTDTNNNPVPSGVYLYQLKTDNQVLKTNKMLLLK